MSIPILYQDEFLVVADKPSGLIVHRTNQSADRVFLVQTLRDQLGKFVYPVHRLDRAASGAIVLAFSGETAQKLQERLREETALKQYLALVRGTAPSLCSIARPLTGENGTLKEAITRFERVKQFSQGALLRVWISTGRRHQIRRHLAHLRHQILGDTVYGKGRVNNYCREKLELNRLFLHCEKLEFTHPETGVRISTAAPLPLELERVLGHMKVVEVD